MHIIPAKRFPLACVAFTLVELLIVIAIVAVLAALLMPALQGALMGARSLSCQNNLKHVALAASQYTDDWSGVLPTNGSGNPAGSGAYTSISSTNWSSKVRPYVNAKELFCPQFMGEVSPLHGAWCSSSYGLNIYAGGGVRANGSPVTPRMKDLNSRKFWFGDGCAYNTVFSGNKWYCDAGIYLLDVTDFPLWVWSKLQFQAHPRRANNFIFGDMHVGALTYDEYNLMWVDGAGWWNRDLMAFVGHH